MKPRTMRILVAVAAAWGTLLTPGRASAWVAVRVGVAPRVAVGVAAGAVAGAAIASAAQPTTVVAPTTVVTPPPAPTAVGSVVTTLPSGCVSSGGRYQCGSTWYQPYFGGNGVYYQIVAP